MAGKVRPIIKKVLGVVAATVMAIAGPVGHELKVDFKPITDPITQDVRARQRRREQLEAAVRKGRIEFEDEPPKEAPTTAVAARPRRDEL